MLHEVTSTATGTKQPSATSYENAPGAGPLADTPYETYGPFQNI